MDQSKGKLSTIDAETESKLPATTTTTTRVLRIVATPGTAEIDVESVPESDTGCVLRLRLAPQEPQHSRRRRVCFHEGVIDNEHLNRRKSKCCCIYRKPHAFDESSSSTDDECEHCFGHPEVKTRNRLEKQKRRRPTCCCCSSCGACQPALREIRETPMEVDKQEKEMELEDALKDRVELEQE